MTTLSLRHRHGSDAITVLFFICPVAYLKTAYPNFTQLSANTVCGRGSVIL